MHNRPWRRRLLTLRAIWTIACLSIVVSSTPAQSDPLPSWNNGVNKLAIIDFVNLVGLDKATTRKWVVVDLKQEWKMIYPER